ncbi:hypothetical protein TWF730_005296 [Orbilia blumenaviensis]|uniref:Uncharacterized protein n=1 Tax=Orbilia blumenaviensis TaxID=1796055 RepID=A0AAV9VKU8_9PEZI
MAGTLLCMNSVIKCDGKSIDIAKRKQRWRHPQSRRPELNRKAARPGPVFSKMLDSFEARREGINRTFFTLEDGLFLIIISISSKAKQSSLTDLSSFSHY